MEHKEFYKMMMPYLKSREAEAVKARNTGMIANVRAAQQDLQRDTDRMDDFFARLNRPSTTVSLVGLQGDTRSLGQSRGLHTPNMQEILARGNQPDPTAIHFDSNSDHMAQIDPLAPHWNLSGEHPVYVNPLKPGPKMPTNG